MQLFMYWLFLRCKLTNLLIFSFYQFDFIVTRFKGRELQVFSEAELRPDGTARKGAPGSQNIIETLFQWHRVNFSSCHSLSRGHSASICAQKIRGLSRTTHKKWHSPPPCRMAGKWMSYAAWSRSAEVRDGASVELTGPSNILQLWRWRWLFL